MRPLAIALALAAALLLPVSSGADAAAGEGDAGSGDAKAEAAGAEEGGEAEEPEEAEEEPSYLDEYAESVRTRVLTGLNGLVTAPADPVMATVEPPKAFAKAGYLRRPLGFASGVLLMLYRAFSGAVDLGFAPMPELPVVSPVPRYKAIPGFEHEDE
jgi:hypothetical protein